MRRCIIDFTLLVLLLAGLLITGNAGAVSADGDWTGHASLMIGNTWLGDSEWGSLDSQEAYGLEIDFRYRHWPVNIAIDFVGWSKEEDALVPGTGRVIRQSADIFKLDLGVRKVWDQGPFFHPFVGGGISLVTAERQSSGIEYDGGSAGIWVDAGIYLAVTTHLSIGAELQYSGAEVDLGPERLNTGGLTAGALVGFRW